MNEQMALYFVGRGTPQWRILSVCQTSTSLSLQSRHFACSQSTFVQRPHRVTRCCVLERPWTLQDVERRSCSLDKVYCRPPHALDCSLYQHNNEQHYQWTTDPGKDMHNGCHRRDAMHSAVFVTATCLSVRLSQQVLCPAERKQDHEMYTIR